MIVALAAGVAAAAIVADHAHLVSPVALAWGSRSVRQHMLARPTKWLALPALLLGAAVLVGATSERHSPAFFVLGLTYWWWNLLHFSMQNYGLVWMLRARGWLAEAAGVGTAAALGILPWALPGPWVLVSGLGLSWLHWLTDIALSASRARRWAFFLAGVLGAGACGFLWKTVSTDPHFCHGLAACTVMYSLPLLLSLRIGLGFVHFLYSRWLWQGPVRGLLVASTP